MNYELYGIEFNKLYPNTKFCKYLKNDLIRRNFQYKLGLNIDTEPFNAESNTKGGLHFYDKSKYYFAAPYRDKLAIVEIPNDALIYVGWTSFKADKIIIKEIKDYSEVDDSFWINMLVNDGKMLRYVKTQTNEICRLAVKQNGLAIQYVNDPSLFTEALCKTALRQNGYALQYIKQLSLLNEELCTIAIKHNPFAIRFIEHTIRKFILTEAICELAIRKDSRTMRYIKNPSNDICKLAVQKDGRVIRFIKNPSEEVCILAVKQNGRALQYIVEQNEDLCRLAVQNNGFALKYVKNQYKTDKICFSAVQQNGLSLQFIKNTYGLPYNEICILAMKQNGLALEYVKELYKTEEICMLAVKQDGRAIKFVNEPKLLFTPLIEELRLDSKYGRKALKFIIEKYKLKRQIK